MSRLVLQLIAALAPRARSILTWRRAALVVLAAMSVLMWARIEAPARPYPGYLHDECYQAFTAHRYAVGDRNAWEPGLSRAAAAKFDKSDMTRWTMYEWVHPPTAKLVMAASIGVFGFRPAAYRLGSVLCGLFLLALVWRFGARMRGEAFGFLALVLASSECLLFVMSRIAMNDIYVSTVVTAAIYAAYRFWTEQRWRFAWLYASGALFGLGVTIKWNAAPLMLGFGLILFARMVHDCMRSRRSLARCGTMLLVWLSAFVLIPIAIYIASYLPYLLNGHGLDDLAQLQQRILRFHNRLESTHPSASRWYEWPLMIKPIFIYTSVKAGVARAIFGFGNPLLWWCFVPAVGYVTCRFLRFRLPADGVVLCGFFGAWLPWIFVTRTTYLQYLLPGVPFGLLAIAITLDDLRKTGWAAARWIVAVYAIAAVAVFVHFYPVITAWPVSAESLHGSRWFWLSAWR